MRLCAASLLLPGSRLFLRSLLSCTCRPTPFHRRRRAFHPAASSSIPSIPQTGSKFGTPEIIPMPHIRSSVEPTPLEHEIFSELLEVVRAAELRTTLRCAGGWVRDKLMGRQSLDIDIALDDMLGREFAERVNQYLVARVSWLYMVLVPPFCSSRGWRSDSFVSKLLVSFFSFHPFLKQKAFAVICIGSISVYLITQGHATHNVAVIMSNPDQSKHLETARMKVRGVWLDLVNLRSEEYAQHSRIPTMQASGPFIFKSFFRCFWCFIFFGVCI
jgi:hypothetical protein